MSVIKKNKLQKNIKNLLIMIFINKLHYIALQTLEKFESLVPNFTNRLYLQTF